jgi:hypothetical protein
MFLLALANRLSVRDAPPLPSFEVADFAPLLVTTLPMEEPLLGRRSLLLTSS